MIFSIIINYGTGLLLGNASYSTAKRKLSLAMGVTINLLLLFYFKYLGFSEQILNGIIGLLHITEFRFEIAQVILPLGISFYTFQSLSYLIDVYRKPELVQRNILNLGLFIAFFPQLIAGPIVRYHDINEQIKERKHSLDLFGCGIERFIVGLAKKVLIANTLAEVVDGILAIPYSSVPSVYLILTILACSLQVYYDFSGYSDMAIGLGRMFGFKILENFNYPMVATSPSDVWRRWHISLSTWFRDYLYIPLGGNRKGKKRQALNFLIVFTLVGLWHGAALNFVFFGFICGIGIALGLLLAKPPGEKQKAPRGEKNKPVSIIQRILKHFGAVILLVIFFMYFRLDMKSSISFYTSLFNITRKVPVPLDILLLTDTRFYIMFVLGIMFSIPWWRKFNIPLNTLTIALKYAALIVLFFWSFGSLATDAYNPFIYFRF
ncbi:alginate O-acetylation protein [Spirochaetia bacterium]|nr:alginate O-acetylation protein [Spirochaetia bacterium]